MGTAFRSLGEAAVPLDPRSLASIRALEAKSAPHLLALLIDIFLEDTPNVLNDLRGAVQIADADATWHLAHRLKGSCASFGATALVRTCEEMEALGISGSLRGAADCLGRLEQEYARVRSALEQIRSAR